MSTGVWDWGMATEAAGVPSMCLGVAAAELGREEWAEGGGKARSAQF